MTSIYLTESDEEAIVDFEKDHEELYDKTNKQGQKGMPLGDVCQQSQAICQSVQDFESQSTRYSKLMHSSSGQVSNEMTEKQSRTRFRINLTS